ncbi:hypothetical protein NHX12_033579 [Muraenolepis orangiensis]|uniref:Uncharacterized protein n=1 Tax=Muraenolepis orangiensis TaxID=630683 RepID=A0A9Q0IIT1_9TELE|nr:hypothetical protein NHX12_033579 [Muraenolepis orangiensis]
MITVEVIAAGCDITGNGDSSQLCSSLQTLGTDGVDRRYLQPRPSSVGSDPQGKTSSGALVLDHWSSGSTPLELWF